MSPRMALKLCIRSVFTLLVFPLFVFFVSLTLLTRTDKSFAGFSQFLSLFPGKPGIYLRAAFYRLACPGTSSDISVGFLTVLSHRNTSIEKGVYIGSQCNIGMCHIGKDTLIGSGVHILSGKNQHGFEDTDQPIKNQKGVFKKIKISDDCWLGNNSVIMTPIPRRCIVASGSIVTKIPKEGDIVAGNPSRTVSNRLKA